MLCIVVFASCLGGCEKTPSSGRDRPLSRDTILESQGIGDRIVDALEQYHQTHGKYPSELSELVPEFLDYLESPTGGEPEWFYSQIADGEHFTLAFGTFGYSKKYPDIGYSRTDSAAGWAKNGL